VVTTPRAALVERTRAAVRERESLVAGWVRELEARGLSHLTAAVLVAAAIERAQTEQRRRGWLA
jgi:hypothetical protein